MKLPRGVTERQKNHWAPYIFDDDRQVAPGTGHPRQWTAESMRRLAAMGLLRPMGFEIAVAGRLARQLAAGERVIDLGDGVMLAVDLEVFFAELEENDSGIVTDDT